MVTKNTTWDWNKKIKGFTCKVAVNNPVETVFCLSTGLYTKWGKKERRIFPCWHRLPRARPVLGMPLDRHLNQSPESISPQQPFFIMWLRRSSCPCLFRHTAHSTPLVVIIYGTDTYRWMPEFFRRKHFSTFTTTNKTGTSIPLTELSYPVSQNTAAA